jgi:hypothetical protein
MMLYDPPIDDAPSYDQLFYDLRDARKLNAELVDALEYILVSIDYMGTDDNIRETAKAAIAKAKHEQS